MSLQELMRSRGFYYYPTDKGTKHSYLEIYSDLFLKFKDSPINLVEIGVDNGGSLRLFEDWFSNANIFGYDIENKIKVPLKRSKVILKNCNEFNLNEFKDFPPHIIIDDGSHLVEDQLRIVQICYPQLQNGGILIIEDVQDIMNDKIKFDNLKIPYKLYDLRLKKFKYDDILLIFQK